MPFEIRDQDGKKISEEQLNKEVAEFWHSDIVQYKEFQNEDAYATVFPYNQSDRVVGNWHQIVADAIERPCLITKVFQQTWDQVRLSVLNDAMSERDPANREQFVTSIVDTLGFLRHHLDLIDHWKSKGYIPVRISL